MSKTATTQYGPVNASPVKSFFVSMLTRDIKLEEAILDLLDNCVDGVLRSKRQHSDGKPYRGFFAEIDFRKDSFSISDNCGGIPWNLHDYAFRMGRSEDRPRDAPGTVGVYGIGMKRAVFKMGAHCLISTHNGQNQYEVEIKPEWMTNETDWMIPVRVAKKSMKTPGTTIYVASLHPGIAARFSEDSKVFKSDLERMVATHYAFIIDKGFEVKINGGSVKPRPTKLIFSDQKGGMKPFVFQSRTRDGVDVFLTVGFTRPIPTEEELANEQEETRYSSIDAGWTVVCNDRAVLYCDRSELTGWGEAGVPRYHTQFIAITGIVEFKCEDASKLPTTTTKRGIDASSTLYLQVKNKMRESMRMFVDYTNKWKGRASEAKRHIEGARALPFEELKQAAGKLPLKPTTKTVPEGKQYRPDLPLPKKTESTKRRISFTKGADEVRCVAEHLFKDRNADPSAVGERCFDIFLREAQK